MKLNNFFQKAYPWIGIIGSLCLIIPSIYKILDNPLLITTDHIILITGLFLMIIFLKEIYLRITNFK